MRRLAVRRHGLYLLALFLSCGAAGCKKSASDLKIHWLPTPIQIDGRFEDWDSIPPSRMHEDHAVLKLANDSQAVYLYYVTDDIDWVRTIKMTGLTLYFNRDGSRDKEFFICYRNGPPVERLLTPDGSTGRPGEADMHPAMRDQLLEAERQYRAAFTCFVRDWIVEKSIPTDGRQGPQAAFGLQDRRFAYEFRIPLRSSEALYYGLGATPGALLGIGAEWGGMPRPVFDEAQPEQTEFGGMGESPTGSFGEMGSGAGAPPGAGGPPKLPEKEEVWMATHLAVFPEASP
jgi:hypothetical protein